VVPAVVDVVARVARAGVDEAMATSQTQQERPLVVVATSSITLSLRVPTIPVHTHHRGTLLVAIHLNPLARLLHTPIGTVLVCTGLATTTARQVVTLLQALHTPVVVVPIHPIETTIDTQPSPFVPKWTLPNSPSTLR
jgi:hypothetical protein